VSVLRAGLRSAVAALNAALMGLALGLPVAAAQPSGRVPAVGVLSFGFAAAVKPQDDAFRRGMQNLGYVEGQNVVVERRYAEGKPDRLRGHVAELVDRPVDVIVALSSTAALAAKRATTAIPIVFVLANDPVGVGLVPSLARPGGNVTGLTPMNAQLNAKRLELFKEAVPGVARIAVLSVSDYSRVAREDMVREMEAAAERLHVDIRVYEVGNREDLSRAFAAMVKDRVGGVTALPLPLLTTERRRITELALRHRLPSVFQWRDYAEAGGLMSYGPNPLDLIRHAARYVDKILKGARPADLPVEQASTFELVVNLKTAKSLGLTVSPSLLLRADAVIE
jgi:putative ABC transport system substrate-binding protein